MEYAICARQLSKSYGGVHAVRALDLSVPRGAIFGLLGANGAGKTTAMECMLGTRRPDGGTVRILGQEPRTNRKQLFQRVGVQFQEGNYQERITVRELCEVTASLYRAPADYRALLARFGIAEKSGSFVQALSGGQRQRLFIVLALLPDPEVVFLDELTTGLDPHARREVWKALAALKEQGLTILLTSHFMDEVQALCDSICILKQGQSIFCGTVAEAIAASPYERFEDAYLWYTEEEQPDENVSHDV
ncbi:ABC transporter ATP-binding protein [Agathobaculum sp. NTUH-O15-33]|uniref:ABC transporter ATP-binding protein n=1 Tax=Agathobaculum sp. NTUH-O15-33 TaxID=3079302 RepID=UPI002958CA82|nr:ABC transporter ATP-binding protein [Agathobaculum sp. NTUH-O15-33]WNX85290.1 ABC transporter ATP-binding protein [Agathobaculum sp. NTUH-O15-33]